MSEMPRRIKIPNDLCTPEIDVWLKKNIAPRGWQEWFGLTNLPYRLFSFVDEKDYILFALRWL